MFDHLLAEIEKIAGKPCEITIQPFGAEPITVGSFRERKRPVLVYDMIPEMRELEGEYDSISKVEEKIQELKDKKWYSEEKEFFFERRKMMVRIGKCQHCGSFGDDKNPSIIGGVYESEEIEWKMPDGTKKKVRTKTHYQGGCSNPQCQASKLWDNLRISTNFPNLYTANGGSVSICHEKGKWKFL